jgi:magnesium chelatase subunit D
LRKGGVFDASASAEIAVAPADARPAPAPADGHDLRASEDLDTGEAPGGAGAGAGYACTCDLDDCPHRRDMTARQRRQLDEVLLQRMMEGFHPHLVTPRRERQQRDVSGKRSTARTEQSRGRYIRARHDGALGWDIALDATIRTAALSQQHRERRSGTLRVEPADLHAKIRERKVGNLFLFVVDCSGSMRGSRQILATQAAVLSLLVDAYQRRDRVGLVAFRDQSASVILRPTTSVDLARAAFQALDLGGPTPLSRGLLTAYELIQRELRRERDLVPVLILVSDGCANVSMGETPPCAEATRVGEMFRARRIRSIVLGTAGRGWRMSDGSLFAPAQDLAAAMGGEFHPMDQLASEGIRAIVDSGAGEALYED